MPLAPLLPSNTARFRAHYAQQGLNHSIQVRSHESPTSLGTMLSALVIPLGATIMPATWSFVEWAPAGSDVFNPVITGLEGTAFGAAAVVDATKAYQLVFVGRTPGGRRVRASFFGANSLATNYRYSPGESASVDNARAVLVSQGDKWRGIDDLMPIWKAYVNVKPNDHWVNELR